MATALLLLAALLPASLGAQTSETWNLEATTLSELLGRQLRVTGPGTSAAGTLRAVHPQSLLLSMDAGNRTVLVRPSDTVWVLGSHKRGGAIAGALAGIALTAGFCIEAFDECGLDVGLLVITPLLALAGAGFGSLRPRWERVLP
ncbi:MAG: hypothetical protein HKN73_11810 [Gemmatimonadetes bacterium]|nr:hypothetical protein [Gemmatimonadota bacterium]